MEKHYQSKKYGHSIIGAMIESFIESDNKKIVGESKYGLSITDPCLSWDDTEKCY